MSQVDQQVADIVSRFLAAGIYPEDQVTPSPKQWRALLESDYEGKIILATAYKFRPNVTAKDIRWLDQNIEYVKVVETLRKDAGLVDYMSGLTMFTWIGDPAPWDMLASREFTNRKALIDFYTHPAFIEVQKSRRDLFEKQQTLILTPL
jgi:hypothetical protein